jgi:ABC-type Fe3+/spermidine/putrescine transport system ATPase subunit
VTHDQEEALTMSDRIAVMNRGKVEQLGTPEELYERPTPASWPDFIGTTNLLTGAIESADGGRAPAYVRLEAATRASSPDGARGRRTVELSVRPESCSSRQPTAARPTARIPSGATVEQVAYLGGNVQYQVRTNGGLSITALAPKTEQRLPVGSDVDVAWPPSEALVLAGRSDDEEEAPA